ncbi:unnamed protein product [Arctia plantaginis]|uniref:Cationic amino acid transporter C-terminal domain-containing protein n=1 Tax=Arctia plantaginis TaxID=874455 RepID=A0A8S1BE35_ARCPL|nr:unnamed protein product [Arctia plantaginis]
MAEGKCHSIWSIVQRKRGSETDRPESISLKRCLNSWDLTALGVGRTLGIGVYLLMGGVALRIAGPSIVLSFLIAALAALLTGLCYAEFATRIPLAGTVFNYTYLAIGQLVAFMIGWINILEFVFASATIARSLSGYIDSVTNHSMSDWFLQVVPLGGSPLSPHFDLFSFLLVLLFGIILVMGVREASLVNGAVCCISLLFVLFIIIAGATAVNVANWSIPVNEVPEGFGVGGFFPYGVWGTLKGAAVCFYCFVGFEVVNTAAEEVKSPRVTIPTSIVAVLSFVFLMYIALSIILTMMVPYYELAAVASLSRAFSSVGWDWPWWIVNVGALFGLSASLFGAIFPLPRLLYSMAADGLLFHWFAKVGTNKQSPIVATVVSTLVIALLSALFEFEQLLLMLCIGALMSYTLVAISVVLLRHHSYSLPDEKTSCLKQFLGRGDKRATWKTKRIINLTMLLYVCLCITIAIVIIYTSRPLAAVIILHILAILTVIIMALQPANDEELSFKTPLVPFLPCISIYVNIHLAAIISWHSWVRVLIWVLIGIPIYFICLCIYTQAEGETDDLDDHVINNGKPTVKIIVESPTPPHTLTRFKNHEEDAENIYTVAAIQSVVAKPFMQEIQIENSAEKEAKIIDLLDQVLQAEEDSYSEVISLKETNGENEGVVTNSNDSEGGIPHRKSLSELSDAGSDASMGNQVLSKYDVIAQVHREDLPKLKEEEEERGDILEDDDEEVTAFNESETNSRTDESGYSDTLDRPTFGGSIEDPNISNIPVPPPIDENYFRTPVPLDFSKFNTMPVKHTRDDLEDSNRLQSDDRSDAEDISNIPVPPPFDENYFKTPTPLNLKKFNTIPSKHTKEEEDYNVTEPRLSIESNNSQGEDNIRFGSSRQIKLMSKLNDIFQKSISSEEDIPRTRSQSTSNSIEAELAVAASRERPQVFLDLKKELLSKETLPNLRHVNNEIEKPVVSKPVESEEDEDQAMSRSELKSKLENIFALGGPQLLAKPRLMKSNPPTPEEAYHTDASSTESISKLPKMEKNDTLKRQKEKFGEVLNSFRISVNNDDKV